MSIHTIKDSILGVPREEDNSTYLIYPQSYPRPHFISKCTIITRLESRPTM